MEFVKNFPFFSIMLMMVSAIVSPVLKRGWARYATFFSIMLCAALNASTLYFTLASGESFIYTMGHFPAPWGNELRAGALEALMATAFAVIMFLSLLGGMSRIDEQIDPSKDSLYFIMADLLLASLFALVYTNDLFTAYVFVEINTLSACALIMARQSGHVLLAATRYMIMSLLGSGLLLIGITLLYDLTGHLLMSNIKEEILALSETGLYDAPLTVTIALISVGLAIKSALAPFHAWLPDAYGYSTPASSAMLSSLASKGYIFLLIKIYYRVIGMDVIVSHRITSVLLVFGLAGAIIGSLSAMRENSIRRMIAFSSVAQIGLIYAGIGLGTRAGMAAAIYHILVHAFAKSMLFISASGLSAVSGNSKRFRDLRGAGFRDVPGGVAFTVGAMSMVGIPLFGGFISKIYLSMAAIDSTNLWMSLVLGCLVASTLLNTVYFLRTVITIYRPDPGREKTRLDARYAASLCAFVIFNMSLGLFSEPIMRAVQTGLAMFE